MIPALILAAGLSSRMAPRDKLMEPVDAEALIRRQVRIAAEAGLTPVVALPAADHPRASALADLAHVPLVLPGSAEGMGGTLRDGIAALPDAPRAMILLADLPEITAEDLRAVLAAADRTPGALAWRGTDQSGRAGHPILIARALRPAFAGLRGDDGGRSVMAAHRDRTVLVPLPGRHATLDLDTPQDWAAWRAATGR
jgi:CTP:molybdopterin cytidylyltransferase MocA